MRKLYWCVKICTNYDRIDDENHNNNNNNMQIAQFILYEQNKLSIANFIDKSIVIEQYKCVLKNNLNKWNEILYQHV